MPNDASVPITPGSGANVDVSQLTVGATTVDRQRFVIADDALPGGLAKVNASGNLSASVDDLGAAIALLLELLSNPLNQDPATGRIRISIEALATGLTLGTLTNMLQMAGFDIKQTLLYDNSLQSWGLLTRGRIT